MRLGIVACETFKRELDLLTDGDPDIVHKEYLEFGLHEYPQELKRAVIDKVNGLEGKVDAVLLGYGTCQSLKDVVAEINVPTVQLKGDDCVGVLLTQAEYDVERKKCAGTFFATPYFADMGTEWFARDMRKKMPNFEEMGITVEWFLEKLFEGYSRCLFVDTGVGEREHFEALAQDFARKLKLRFESRSGTLDLLRDALAQAKGVGRSALAEGPSELA